ncbi:MAG: hypothetical protein Q9174_007231 [Haloplaca sp. 1 TL-2023]
MGPGAFVMYMVTALSMVGIALCQLSMEHYTFLHRAQRLQPRQANPLTPLASYPYSVPSSPHGTLVFSDQGNVTRVLMNNPPINLLNVNFISDLYTFLLDMQPGPGKTTPKVVIFSSANPDYFISHFDLTLLTQTAGQAALLQLADIGRMLQNITSTIFIAEINGRTFGGGQELSSQMDMRFAGPNALVSQYENSAGFVAQVGGQLFLGSIIGKARALEHLLASGLIDARMGTQLGLYNNHYCDKDTLRREVDALAARIGLYPQPALNDTKYTLSYLSPTAEQLNDQITRFAPVAATPESQNTVTRLTRMSDETANEFERNIPNSVVRGLYYDGLDAVGDRGQAILDAAQMYDRGCGLGGQCQC